MWRDSVVVAAAVLPTTAAPPIYAAFSYLARDSVCMVSPLTARIPLVTDKMECASEARYLRDTLQRMIGTRVFLDSSDLSDLRGLVTKGVSLHPPSSRAHMSVIADCYVVELWS